MSRRPPAVRITDLARPTFSDDVMALRAAMAEMAPACLLEPDALREAAVSQTGLDDFGDPWFREALDVLCRSLRDEARLDGPGVVNVHTTLVQLLANRLRIEGLVRREPAIAEQPIAAPIIVAGLPRTGTTHMHNLLAADPALRYLPYWESLEPVLSPEEAAAVAGGAPDPRLERTAFALDFMGAAIPYFERMHEMTVDHAHEEIQLLAISISTMLFETFAPMPSWREWYCATDQTPAYEYMRRVLQAMQWLRGGDRWVLKSPQHLEQFGVLDDVFPDATFVVTHRDPAAVVASLTTLTAYTARMFTATVDLDEYGRYWSTRIAELLAACHRDRDLLPAERTIDVRFDNLLDDDMGTLRDVYRTARQPFDAGTQASLRAYLDEHPRGRFGTVEYDLAEFGLDAAEIRAANAAYASRFRV